MAIKFRSKPDTDLLFFPHPSLRATFSRREKEIHNAALCTPAIALPDGSAAAAKLASQAIAAGEEQAIDLPPGTVSAAAGPG